MTVVPILNQTGLSNYKMSERITQKSLENIMHF